MERGSVGVLLLLHPFQENGRAFCLLTSTRKSSFLSFKAHVESFTHNSIELVVTDGEEVLSVPSQCDVCSLALAITKKQIVA